VAVVVVLAVVGIVVSRRGGDSEDGVAVLFGHLPEPDQAREIVVATDLEAARGAGYADDAELEELGRTQRETGTYPGLLAQRLRFAQLLGTEEFTARTGVEPGDVDCVAGTFVAEVSSGSFDPTEVAGSAVGAGGDLVASEDRLALVSNSDEDPRRLLEPLDEGSLADNEAVMDTLEALRDRDAYTFAMQVPIEPEEGAPLAAGAGVAQGDDDARLLVVVWAFDDDDAAAEGREQMASTLSETFDGVTSVNDDGLAVDGNVVAGAFPLRQPESWTAPLLEFESLLPSPNGD